MPTKAQRRVELITFARFVSQSEPYVLLWIFIYSLTSLFQVSLRISSLDYLGVVAARLRRDAVQSRLKIDTIDAIIETVREAEGEAGEEEEEDEELEEEEKRTRFLQRVLLDYLAVNGGEVSVLLQHDIRVDYVRGSM